MAVISLGFQILRYFDSKTRICISASCQTSLFEGLLHVMIEMLSSHLMQSDIIINGHVRKCVKLSLFSLTIDCISNGVNYFRLPNF